MKVKIVQNCDKKEMENNERVFVKNSMTVISPKNKEESETRMVKKKSKSVEKLENDGDGKHV